MRDRDAGPGEDQIADLVAQVATGSLSVDRAVTLLREWCARPETDDAGPGEEAVEAVFYAGYGYATDERYNGPITAWTTYRRNEGRGVVASLARPPEAEGVEAARAAGADAAWKVQREFYQPIIERLERENDELRAALSTPSEPGEES